MTTYKQHFMYKCHLIYNKSNLFNVYKDYFLLKELGYVHLLSD